MTPTRRRVLVGLGALVGVAGAGVLVEAQPPAPRLPRTPLRVLTPRAYAALAAATEVILPVTPGLPDPFVLGVPERVDALLDAMPPGAGAEVVTALQLLESPLVSAFLGGAPTPFSRRAPADRARILDAWRDSRFATRRTVWKAVINLVKSAYWSDRSVDGWVGYHRLVFADAP